MNTANIPGLINFTIVLFFIHNVKNIVAVCEDHPRSLQTYP